MQVFKESFLKPNPLQLPPFWVGFYNNHSISLAKRTSSDNFFVWHCDPGLLLIIEKMINQSWITSLTSKWKSLFSSMFWLQFKLQWFGLINERTRLYNIDNKIGKFSSVNEEISFEFHFFYLCESYLFFLGSMGATSYLALESVWVPTNPCFLPSFHSNSTTEYPPWLIILYLFAVEVDMEK